MDFIKENNERDPIFKVDNNVRISKYKNIFAKGLQVKIGLKRFS